MAETPAARTDGEHTARREPPEKRVLTLVFAATAAASVLGLGAGATTACSTFGSSGESTQTSADASSGNGNDDDAAIGPDGAVVETDGGVPSKACSPGTPFTVTEVAELNSLVDESTARLTDDELTIYFGRLNAAGNFIMMAQRASKTDAFGAPTRVNVPPIKGGSSGETDPWISPDQLQLYYSTLTAETAQWKVYRATRTAPTNPFDSAVPVFKSASWQRSAFIVPATNELWFTFTSGPSTNSDPAGAMISRVSLVDGSEPMVGLAGSSQLAGAPVLSADALTLYYAAATTSGAVVIHQSVRLNTNDPFTVMPSGAIAELASTGTKDALRDAPSWLSKDGCRLYFTSNRGTNRGLDIYLASRKPE